jgi:hypothetical protein
MTRQYTHLLISLLDIALTDCFSGTCRLSLAYQTSWFYLLVILFAIDLSVCLFTSPLILAIWSNPDSYASASLSPTVSLVSALLLCFAIVFMLMTSNASFAPEL